MCTQLKVLKTKEDGAILTMKADLLARYTEWRDRIPRQAEEAELVVEEGGGGVTLEGALYQIDADTVANEECIAVIPLLDNIGTEEVYQSATV